MENSSDTVTPPVISRFGRQSQWFLAELIVIIAGVLIALGIDEWRGNLEDAALEKQYLRQLIADLRSTEEQLANANSGNAPFEKAANELLAAFEIKDRPNLEVVRRMLSEMALLEGPVPQISTAESMVSAGDLGLVNDPSVRAQITRYLSFARDQWLFPLYQREERHRELHFRILVFAQTHGISPSHWKGHVNTATGPGGGPDIEAFFDNAEAYAHVAAFVENRAILSWYQEMLDAEAKHLRESLEKYLSSE